MSRYSCDYCAAPLTDCTCEPGSNDVAGYTPSGYPIDADGQILTHLCTMSMLREIERSIAADAAEAREHRSELATPVPNLRVRQAGFARFRFVLCLLIVALAWALCGCWT